MFRNLPFILEELLKLLKKAMQDEWHVMPRSISAFWMEATFISRMQMQIQERNDLACSKSHISSVDKLWPPLE